MHTASSIALLLSSSDSSGTKLKLCRILNLLRLHMSRAQDVREGPTFSVHIWSLGLGRRHGQGLVDPMLRDVAFAAFPRSLSQGLIAAP